MVIKTKRGRFVDILINFALVCILVIMILLLIRGVERRNYTCITFYTPTGETIEYEDITHIINKLNGSIEFTTKDGVVMTLSDDYIVTRIREY